MENLNIQSPELAHLYELILKANRQQTEELKSEFQTATHSLTEKLQVAYEEIKILKLKCADLERRIRKNNVLVFGVSIEKEDSLSEETVGILNRNLESNIINCDIGNIYKLGKNKNSPILIEFTSYLKKISLFKDKEKLKKLQEKGITIKNDLSKEDREDLKILKKHQKFALAQNKEAKIKGYKLIINGIAYSVKELESVVESEEESSTDEEIEESNNPTATSSNLYGQLLSKGSNITRSNKREKSKNKSSPVNTRSGKKKK